MSNPEQTPWMTRFRNAYAVHNVVSHRTDLPFFLIQWDRQDSLKWRDLGDPRQRLQPFHFETHFGNDADRDAYYLKSFAAALAQPSAYVGEIFGFSDLFVPLTPDAVEPTFLFAGQFYREPPTWESLSAQWAEVSGREPSSADPDFVHFVRMALRVPVVDDALLEALTSFAQLWGEHLTANSDDASLAERIDALNRDYFTPLWPIEGWIDSVLHPDKFHLTPWHHEGELTDWMKEGMGIERLPTTAMALMPIDDRRAKLDPVQILIRNAQIQRACITFARARPQAAATRLQDYGVSIIASTKPGASKTQMRLELRELARSFRDDVRRQFGVRVVIGIGNTLAPGARLHPSHEEAVLALHVCSQVEQDVMFFDEHGAVQRPRYGDLQAAAFDLGEAMNRQNATQIKLERDRYVSLVLRYAAERIEVARSLMLATLFQLLSEVQRRQPMRAEARERFADELTESLEVAQSLYHVITAFGVALERLAFVSSKAWQGPSVMRIEATLQFLAENFAEPLPLPMVARKAGFSVPAFSRVFKKATGTSFLSYLRGIRVERVKSLLVTTPMTTEQIAHACGFKSQHHLIRSFKKVTRQTPGAYRKDQP
jgi:AraC-like DNA-binding protein